MPKGQNEVDKFFDGLPSDEPVQADILADEAPKDGAGTEKEGEGAGDGSEKGQPSERKNRRQRRLESQLQTERELRIAAEAKAAGRTEAEQFSRAVTAEPPEKWLRIYGDTPESRMAWNLNKELFEDYAKKAKDEALSEVDARQKKVADQQKEFESFIDAELEGIEDEFDVDVTSDSPAARKARREFLELVEKLSPKDGSGVITGYADFGEAWQLYQKQKAEPKDGTVDKKKDLASRGMQRGGGEEPAEKQRTPGFFGWMNDAGINS